MAPSFAHLPPYARAAFIAAQLDALAGPDEPIEDPFEAPTEALIEQQAEAALPNPPAAEPAPEKRKKKRKLTASNRAKTILRAARKPKRRTETDDPDSSFEHHRRKCQVCNHPDREAIEELFIAWHSPRSIRIEFGAYHRLDCSSIYRHARAVGLYAKRRKNLRAVFDLILEHAGNIEPTAHGIAAIVRAYSCLTDTHDWIEPERRVHIVNHVYRHDIPIVAGVPVPAPADSHLVSSAASFASTHASPDLAGADRFHRAASSEMGNDFPSNRGTDVEHSSFRANYPRDVVGSDSLPASAAPRSPAPVLATSHSPLATRISNRHTPGIRITSNSHKTNDRNISNRHISHSVSTQSEKEKSPKTTVASRKDKKDKMDG